TDLNFRFLLSHVCFCETFQFYKVSSAEDSPTAEFDIRCLLYPTNILNCSWSFLTLPYKYQLFVSISVCEDDTKSLNYLSEERTGSWCSTLPKIGDPMLILQFNITLYDSWTAYTYGYEMDQIEVLSPPQNISASVKDGGLLVTWDLPQGRREINPPCFEYQLDLGDQEGPKELSDQLSYTELNADPTRTYRVRIRTRMDDACQKNSQWSDWSHTVMVKQSPYKLNVLVIVAVSLGVPMILLAVLLLICHQRYHYAHSTHLTLYHSSIHPSTNTCVRMMATFLFPMCFQLFYPPLPVEPEAEIMEVEDTEQKPGKVF
ncbi:hypothetical protein L3Q82_021760, partial [Scortum barcoo]